MKGEFGIILDELKRTTQPKYNMYGTAMYIDMIRDRPESILDLDDEFQTPELCELAVKLNPMLIKDLKQTDALCKIAILKDTFVYQYINNPSYEVTMFAIHDNGFVLEFVKEQTLELCISAIRRQPLAIRFVKWEQIPAEYHSTLFTMAK